MITDIVFDLGNVLVPLDREKSYWGLMPHLPTDMAHLARTDRPAFEKLFLQPARAMESGEADFDEFWERMQKVLGISMDKGPFHQLYCDIFVLDDEMAQLGKHLSESHGTWLASNTSRVHYDWILDRFPRVEFYRDAALSYEIGLMKPASGFYEGAIRQFGINPYTSVFVDDLEENVVGAVNAGLKGIVYRDKAKLLRELEQLGVWLPGIA
ncbi:HAD family hydrolase [Thermodesulfobacteriota bacterium]